MKREILFKGKIQGTDSWIIGLPHSVYRECIDSIQTLDGTVEYIKTDTLCQFTGLLDKKGNRIFEGDWISQEYFADGKNHNSKQQVYFSDKYHLFMIDESFDQDKSIGSILSKEIFKYKFEIIGNIHN